MCISDLISDVCSIDLTPSYTASNQQITIDLAGSTQKTGSTEILAQFQDCLSVGELQGVTVDEEGFVKASFSNGDNQVLGKIAFANFSNPTGLSQLGNSTRASSGISGEPTYSEAQSHGRGRLKKGAVERSKRDKHHQPDRHTAGQDKLQNE